MRDPYGVLVDAGSGEMIASATALQLRYAVVNPDGLLRIDHTGRPYPNADARWLQANTRLVRIRDAPAEAQQGAREAAAVAQWLQAAESDARLLVSTAAAVGDRPWAYLERPDLVNGRAAVLLDHGERSLVFVSDSGEAVALDESDIVRVTRVGRGGLNIIVDVVHGTTLADVRVFCLVGPRGRMRTIFATLGHPI